MNPAIKSKKMRIKSTKRTVNQVIETLKPYINEMVEQIVKWEEKQTERAVSVFGRETIEFGLIFDIVKSLEKHTNKTDKIVGEIYANTIGGKLEIQTTIERAGENYSFATDVITAGGYNIQCFHYRYLVKTKLPRTGENEDTLRIKKDLQKRNRVQNLIWENDGWKREIEKARASIKAYSNFSRAEIITHLTDSGKHKEFTWAKALENDAQKNYNNSEAEFDAAQLKYLNHQIESWKSFKIGNPKSRIHSLKQVIEQNKRAIKKTKNQ